MTMLLPSALACDTLVEPPRARRQPAALFVSPPASPPNLSSQTAFDNIITTCRSLQALMATTAPAPALDASVPLPLSLTSLPTPPLAHAPPPLKLRLRGRASLPPPRIVKRANKRRRAHEDDMGRHDVDGGEQGGVVAEPTPQPGGACDGGGDDDDDDDDNGDNDDGDDGDDDNVVAPLPSTPKRARIAPEQLPLGLGRSDFHDMHLLSLDGPTDSSKNEDGHVEADGAAWTAEDDRVLVELVLEKLKLSKTDWQDCARSLGRHRHSLTRRWKSLVAKGDVGLKTRSRPRLHATWR